MRTAMTPAAASSSSGRTGTTGRYGAGMAHGTHDFEDYPRNADLLVWVNGELRARAEAVVSVFDSGLVLGDGVWEGLRVSGGQPAIRELPLHRLFDVEQATQ